MMRLMHLPWDGGHPIKGHPGIHNVDIKIVPGRHLLITMCRFIVGTKYEILAQCWISQNSPDTREWKVEDLLSIRFEDVSEQDFKSCWESAWNDLDSEFQRLRKQEGLR